MIKNVALDYFPPEVQDVWRWVTGIWHPHNHKMRVVHYRNDALFVHIVGICNAYKVAKFIRAFPGIYVEIGGCVDGFILRLFWSEWMRENELPRMGRMLESTIEVPQLDELIELVEEE